VITKRIVRWIDDRLGVGKVGRTTLAKVFPDHWSFMLGEIALYSFLLLVATGVFLTLFFEPSTAETVYTGSYAPLVGERVSAAYGSAVALSYDVPVGLLMRQTHHWTALVFIAAIALHLCRIFFTAAFRKPRELNWVVGVTLLLLAVLNGYAGYSMIDDLLSGTGLRIGYSILLSIPVVGEWLTFLVFGGEFPGTNFIPRLYIAHVLLIPGLIAGLIAVHLAVLVRQKHTHFPGPGRSDRNVVGSRMWPTYAFRSLALLCALAGVLFALGGLAQINPVWLWGDFDPAAVTAPAQPDWYIGWAIGALRLAPAATEFTVFGHLVPSPFLPAVVLPGLTFLLLYAWPLIDKWLTGDREAHHVTGRPRDCPIRTAIGGGALAFYILLLVGGGVDIIAYRLEVPIGTVVAVVRTAVLVVPVVVGLVVYVVARALRDSGAEGVLHLEPKAVVEASQRHHPTAERAAGATAASDGSAPARARPAVDERA
jgi:ubiquinol-cytochrome c reductase cytochrome b subunit